MTDLKFLQLQPVEPDDDDSPLDEYPHDETIILDDEAEEEPLDIRWNEILEAEEIPETLTSSLD